MRRKKRIFSKNTKHSIRKSVENSLLRRIEQSASKGDKVAERQLVLAEEASKRIAQVNEEEEAKKRLEEEAKKAQEAEKAEKLAKQTKNENVRKDDPASEKAITNTLTTPSGKKRKWKDFSQLPPEERERRKK